MAELNSKQIQTIVTTGILFWLVSESVFVGLLSALIVFATFTESDEDEQ